MKILFHEKLKGLKTQKHTARERGKIKVLCEQTINVTTVSNLYIYYDTHLLLVLCVSLFLVSK